MQVCVKVSVLVHLCHAKELSPDVIFPRRVCFYYIREKPSSILIELALMPSS